jgi:hypothetical protein
MQEAGFGKLSFEELLRARDHGVDARYVKGMRDAGFRCRRCRSSSAPATTASTSATWRACGRRATASSRSTS